MIFSALRRQAGDMLLHRAGNETGMDAALYYSIHANRLARLKENKMQQPSYTFNRSRYLLGSALLASLLAIAGCTSTNNATLPPEVPGNGGDHGGGDGGPGNGGDNGDGGDNGGDATPGPVSGILQPTLGNTGGAVDHIADLGLGTTLGGIGKTADELIINEVGEVVTNLTQQIGVVTGLDQPVDRLTQSAGGIISGLGDALGSADLPGGLSTGVGGLLAPVTTIVGGLTGGGDNSGAGGLLAPVTGLVGGLTGGLAGGL